MDSAIDPPPRSVEGNENGEAFVIRRNEIYGRHLVATRLIPEGDLVIEEFPLVASACGKAVPCRSLGPLAQKPENCFPFCLTCGKGAGEGPEVCRRCKWPICDNFGLCQNDPIHAEGECGIFAANEVLPQNFTLSDYDVIIVLRDLLLRSKDPSKWDQIQQLVSHTDGLDAKILGDVIDFIRKKCKLVQFQSKTIEEVVGMVGVNPYWAFPYLGRCMSLIFDKANLFTHDCDSNTREQLFEKEEQVQWTTQTKKVIGVRLFATRVIHPGDILTIPYLYPAQIQASVEERQKYLKTYYHFTCSCRRCAQELTLNGAQYKNGNAD